MRTTEAFYAIAVLVASMLAGALLAIGISALAPSQPPPPTETEESQPAQQGRNNENQIGANENRSGQPDTATTAQRKRNVDGARNANEGQDNNDGSAPDWSGWVALFTFGLLVCAAVQAWVYWRQAGLMQDALAETRRSAGAAQQSADVAERAMKTSDRPFIVIEPVTLVDFFPGKRPFIDFGIRNAGRTPAFFTDGKIRRQTHRGELRSPPDYGEPHTDPDKSLSNTWLNPDQRMGNAVGWDKPIDADLYWDVVNGELILTFFGYVTFRDAFGVSRTIGFGLRYVPQKKGGIFTYVSLPGYNYEHENPPAQDQEEPAAG